MQSYLKVSVNNIDKKIAFTYIKYQEILPRSPLSLIYQYFTMVLLAGR